MTKKLIAFDIDGTLLDNQKQPLESTFTALERLREQGHIVTIATGRSYFLAQPIIEQLAFDNYILCNGAAGFIQHKQVYKNTLNLDSLIAFINKAQSLKIDVASLTMQTSKRHSTFNMDYIQEAMFSFGAKVPDLDETFHLNQAIYQSLAYYDEHLDGHFDEEFPDFRFVRWHPYSVDIVPKNGSKANTILHLADYLGISHDNTVAFGDGLNDFEMLQAVGTGVAMANGHESVKEVATIVTDSNENDGIYNALKKLNLI